MTSAWCSLIPDCAKEPGHEPPCVTVAEALRGEINVEARRDLERQEACGLAFEHGRLLEDAAQTWHADSEDNGICDAISGEWRWPQRSWPWRKCKHCQSANPYR